MCGIVGSVSSTDVKDHLLKSLSRLEYRGYDSAGIALLNEGRLSVRKCKGKIRVLAKQLAESNFHGSLGIAHTRWATHGKPTSTNAHPHTDCTERIALVHNGIIENFQQEREALKAKGHTFTSDTDTEVIAHLIEENLKEQGNLEEAIKRTLGRLEGAYGFALIFTGEPNKLYFARLGSPLVVGLGEKNMMIASDIPALLPFTRKVILLDNGEWGYCTREKAFVFNGKGTMVEKKVTTVNLTSEQAEKGGYPHFMLKEIFEQPEAIALTMAEHIRGSSVDVQLEGTLETIPEKTKRFFFVACGTAYHAGLTATYLWERWLPQVSLSAIASEFRYRKLALDSSDTLIVISQSGETADTLAAMRKARQQGAKTIAICNVLGSTLAREADAVLFTRAGPEIGVASTKAYTCQIVALYLLGIHFARKLNRLGREEERCLVEEIQKIPERIDLVLQRQQIPQQVARTFSSNTSFLYLGRHIFFPQAMEGALKLKEISYIHAEGYPAGEMKHGPIALIDRQMPVVCLAPQSEIYEKTVSNIKEVEAREGRIISVATEGDQNVAALSEFFLPLPPCPDWSAAVVMAPYLQLLAYFIAKERGCEIDQPRNLAKSVTVE